MMKTNTPKTGLIFEGSNEISDMIKAKLSNGDITEKIRVQMRVLPEGNVMGYAIEVTRQIAGQEYDYVGFVSMIKIRTDPDWLSFQKTACENAFKATIKEVTQ